MLAELITRGAGQRDSEELTLALDNLGLDRSESVGTMHTRFWGATVASNLAPALEIYADILRRPTSPRTSSIPSRPWPCRTSAASRTSRVPNAWPP